MSRMFRRDAYCLGLIYAYIYSSRQMVLVDDLKKFHDIIERNLEKMNSLTLDIYATVWNDNYPSIYYQSRGKNGEIYYVLYPDFDLQRAIDVYIGCVSLDILVASQMDNVLGCIDLKKEDGKIISKSDNSKINKIKKKK